MARYECSLCGYIYDEAAEGKAWEDLGVNWRCPVCGSDKFEFAAVEGEGVPAPSVPVTAGEGEYLAAWARRADEVERYMADIHAMATTGRSVSEPMRTQIPAFSWDDLLIKGAQLARLPLNEQEAVNARTVIGPNAKHPLIVDSPIYVTHMSFGALSREAQIAIARGTAAVKTAMCSGEGGILDEALDQAYRFIFEYVPNRYSLTDAYLSRVDAVEIKIGQSAKPGLGGHLPAEKVTREIAAIRGFPEGVAITSPAHFPDIRTRDELRDKVEWLKEKTGHKPVGIKIAAGNIEADLQIALYAEPDFITIDGRPGSTGSAPKFVKGSTSIPTIFALFRARRFLDRAGARGVSLVVTGGLRVSSDFAKALALGADAVAIGSAALMALGCQQYRICQTGRCPVGITTHDPALRARFDVERSAERLANFIRVSTEEVKDFARLTGNADVHCLSIADLCTTNSEISGHTDVEHV
jgi:glutamate synthase domain-containing protein 2/rubredoxin